jgi:hypothetical protein
MSKPIAKLHSFKPWRLGLRLGIMVLSCAWGAAPARAQMPAPVSSLSDAERLSESIADQHGILISEDKTCLFYRRWPAAGGSSSDRVVIVLHGIGYQSGPYKVIADALNPQGMDVYALDARAHGLSCGRRGYIGTPAEVALTFQLLCSLFTMNGLTRRFICLAKAWEEPMPSTMFEKIVPNCAA